MYAIINRGTEFGTLNGVILKNEEIRKEINQCLKKGTAKKIIDTDHTLMYDLEEQKPISNGGQIFENILKPFMP